jgi:sugar lactone lactonase YvrE
MKKIFATCLFVIALGTLAAQTPQQLMQEAQSAYKAKDYPRYLERLETLAKMRPGHPVVLFNLAGAYSLNNRAEEASATLQRLAAMQVWFDVDAEHDFDAVREAKSFQKAAEEVRKARSATSSTSKVAFTLPEKDLITEGITRDPKSGAFFVSSVHRKKILRIAKDGAVSTWLDLSEGHRGISGMGIDPSRRLLYAASSASERVDGFAKEHDGDTAVLQIDLDQAKVIRELRPPAGVRTFFDDLTVGRDGTLYVSDSTGAVYRKRADANDLETFIAKGTIRSPQGLALTPDQQRLYVADYGGPIAIVQTASGEVTKLKMPDDFPAMGIDGLATDGKSLMVVQNGVEPHRVARLWLSRDGRSVTRWRIVDRNQPLMDEPTIGIISGRDYYWIGASQGNKFDANPPQLDKLHEAVVYRLKL